MALAEDLDRALAGLVGRPLDDHVPALTVRSVHRLGHADVEALVAQGRERPQLLDEDLVLEIVFDLAGEPGPWLWRLALDAEDLPGPDEDLSPGEHLQGELTWRLLEWRDAQESRPASTAPRLLRAS
jgi:hypothetical protein